MATQTADVVKLAQDLLNLVTAHSTDAGQFQEEQSLETYQAAITIQSYCDRICQLVMGPTAFTALVAESAQESQALYLASSLKVPDVLGTDAKTLQDLAAETGTSTHFLGTVMSCINGRGFFDKSRRDGEEVYRNNTLSEILCEKHPKTMKSAVEFIGDEGFKSASRLQEVAHAQDPQVSGMKLAFGFQQSVFDWMALPENAFRGERVGFAMKQLHGMANVNVPSDYPWHELASPIVDCGGGIGSLELALVKDERNRGLKFVIFDIAKTIANGQKVWAAQDAAVRAQVSFAPGDFLAVAPADTGLPRAQPTYLIRHVLHDWTDAQVLAILRNVRAAMGAGARLLVCEMLLGDDSPRFVRTTSMQLLALNNGITRTQDAMVKLVEEAGFVVEKVHHMRAVDSIIEACIAKE